MHTDALGEGKLQSAQRENDSAPSTRAGAAVGPTTEDRPIVLDLGWILVALGAVTAALALVSLVQDLVRFHLPALALPHVWRLDVDAEVSVPTWFATSVILLNALAVATVAAHKLRSEAPLRWHWLLLALILAGLSLDESAALHNALSGALSSRITTSGIFYFVWVIPAMIACLIGVLIYIPFILDFSGWARRLLVASAVVFLSGAVGLEMLSGAEVEAHGTTTLTYRLLTNAEEALEGGGMLMFLAAILLYARERCPSFRIVIR